MRALQAVPFSDLIQDLPSLRTNLILCSRLLCLYRSHDLANLKRTVSVLGGKTPFVKIKRKGQNSFKWERMVSIPPYPQISPFHLLQAYVSLTRSHEKVGGPVLLSLKPPYKPISADTVGSITKNFLSHFGISSSLYGPHSTRGAGVGL